MTVTTIEPAAVASAASRKLHRIVVVGGGAGGLELVTRLGDRLGRRRRADIALVEKARTHLWKPLLHEVAAGSMDVSRHELDYLAQAYWHGFRFQFGEMIALDRTRRQVHLCANIDEDGRLITPVRSIGYDTLVIAIGSVSNDFGTPGVKEHAICLDTPEQAQRFNRRIVNACLRVHTQAEPVRPGQLHVAIIGAGATGTELSAELRQHGAWSGGLRARQDRPRQGHQDHPDRSRRSHRAGAAPAIVGRDGATARRTRRGTPDRRAVTEVGADGVHLAGGDFIPSELVVWAAGVRGPQVLRDLDGLETSPSGQLVVARNCRRRGTTMSSRWEIAPGWSGRRDALNSAARPSAHQQASHLLRQLRRRLEGRPVEPFVYHDFGSLVSLGEFSTIGSLMGFLAGKGMLIEGYVARLMYRSLYKMHETALHGPLKVGLDTISRLLTRRTEPHVKLH